ncbi:hypothetical protein BDA99DRAFT_525341 [Phascolomyces articulosus]|uniref:Uncharacterized protein n=1 Tax=Phascolomyces articulosus TaxID=60185 RepID=A0AAD5JPY2_9FUNG|nr:hypothetical protein BDA99DRAFT_525341 [Phascolomyces articulosus]
MANRISLRLIVFACICNIIYNVMTLAITGIVDYNPGCNVIIFFVIATDIMSCMSLAMIGVNLVMILIVRVNHPIPGGIPTGRTCW